MYRVDCDWTADQLNSETRKATDFLNQIEALVRQAQAECPDVIGFQEIEIALEDPICTTRAQIVEIDEAVAHYEDAA